MVNWLSTLVASIEAGGATYIAFDLFDMFLIVVLARLIGNALAKIGQPRVE